MFSGGGLSCQLLLAVEKKLVRWHGCQQKNAMDCGREAISLVRVAHILVYKKKREERNGADYRNRTGDLLITSQLLYQLS